MNMILSRYKLVKISSLLIALAFLLSACSNSFTSTSNSTEETSTILTPEDIYSLVAPSTIEIKASNSNYSSTGTGFFDDINGTVITNYHVIEDAKEAKIKTYDGKEYDVLKVLGYDKQNDIAILSTKCTSSTPVVKSSSPVATGQKVYALGSSLGLTGTFSEGIVSTASRDIDGTNYIQITAPISHGNSGGPLLNEQGEVIGITSAGFVDGQNLNLAIPIQNVAKVPRNKNLTLQELFNKTPAAERVINHLRANGEQKIFVETYKTFNLEYTSDVNTFFSLSYNEKWNRLSIEVNYDDTIAINYRISLSFSDSNYVQCGLGLSYTLYDYCFIFDSITRETKNISNNPEKNTWELMPDVINGKPTDEQLDAVENLSYKDTAKLLNLFNGWLKENNLPCDATDFGFNMQ